VEAAREGFADALRTERCELCIWHDPKLDKLGHRFGIHGEAYESYALMLDSFLDDLVGELGGDTTFVITSDHGMTDAGNHGGAQPEARASFLFATGPGIRHRRCSAPLEQTSIAPLVSVLLGAPIPYSASSEAPDLFTEGEPKQRERLRLEERDRFLRLGRAVASRRSDAALGSIDTVADAQLEIDAAHREAPRVLLMLALGPLVLLLACHRHVFQGWTWVNWGWGFIAMLGGWVFGNVIYPRWSFSDAATLHSVVVTIVLIVCAVWSTRFTGRRRFVGWLVALIAVLSSVDSHWVLFLEPLVFGLFGWALGFRWSRSRRWLLASSLAIGGLVVTTVGWCHWEVPKVVSGLRAYDVIVGMAASGACGAWLWPRQGWRARGLVGAAASLIYLGAGKLPIELRLLLAAMIVLAYPIVLLAFKRNIGASATLLVGASLFFSAQMGPIEWAGALTLGVLLGRGLSKNGIDIEFGRNTAALLRAMALLGLGYLWVAALGNQLDFSDVQVLVGLLGGAVPLSLPIVVALTALFYSAPLVFALGVWSGTCGNRSRLLATAEATRALVGLRLAFHLVSFTWGRMAWGSWEKQLLEVLLLVVWWHVIELAVLYVRTAQGAPKLRFIVSVSRGREFLFRARGSAVATSALRAK
jgi:hypothetical protein